MSPVDAAADVTIEARALAAQLVELCPVLRRRGVPVSTWGSLRLAQVADGSALRCVGPKGKRAILARLKRLRVSMCRGLGLTVRT